ncbi:nuclease, partial [Klebsiella pneumoniae]|nr:nuclease [Klebsiella pneumoniae]
VDYLLGKDRQREGASVLQGKPEEIRELIDASPYVKKYTSGVLWYQGNRIAANLAEIRQQRDTLSKLQMQTWGVTYLENRNG